MKTIFTGLLLLCFCISSMGQNPFQKRKDLKKQNKTVLKATQANDQPTSVVSEWWNNNAWENPTTSDYTYNGEGQLWIEENPHTKITHTYHANGELTESLTQNWDGMDWVNFSKHTWLFDSENNQSENSYSTWVLGAWEYSYGYRYAAMYDGNGDTTEEIYSEYNSTSEQWEENEENCWKTDLTFDNGLLTEQVEYSRENGMWVIGMKTLWFYNVSDILESALAYEHDGTKYNLMGRYTDVLWEWWDPVGHVETSLIETYTQQSYGGPAFPNEEPNDDLHYTNVEKVEATYPSGLGGGTPPMTVEITQTWDGSVWEDSERWTWEQMADYESYFDEELVGMAWLATDYNKEYNTPILMYHQGHDYDASGNLIYGYKDSQSYDAFGNKTEEKNESHDGDEMWAISWGSMYNYTYDGGTSKILIKVTQNWDSNSSMYVNNMRETFDYTPTNLNALEQSGIKIYPTSFTSNIAVKSALEGTAYFYSLTGNLVHQQELNSGQTNISTSSFERGYYLIKIVTPRGEFIQKAIKH
ncbi:T9SS type A sorting domain-containing protein [Carboxylicivirga sp. N1Y90]|uniref:T9SS type A sorting domain-containing protein n=1 Tax=Carboxylicivirga fragile TaxID=3417571 RepID=UPI003D32A057|nr:T9SS type A sorting domain-containing protein [Marinilabiliaceae bacterium N1Y90]